MYLFLYLIYKYSFILLLIYKEIYNGGKFLSLSSIDNTMGIINTIALLVLLIVKSDFLLKF